MIRTRGSRGTGRYNCLLRHHLAERLRGFIIVYGSGSKVGTCLRTLYLEEPSPYCPVHGPGGPSCGHLTYGGCAWSPGSVVRPSSVQTSERHSTRRYSRQRLIARILPFVKSPPPRGYGRWPRQVQTIYVLVIPSVHSKSLRKSRREENDWPTTWGHGVRLACKRSIELYYGAAAPVLLSNSLSVDNCVIVT
jgi:hypothetical protein